MSEEVDEGKTALSRFSFALASSPPRARTVSPSHTTTMIIPIRCFTCGKVRMERGWAGARGLQFTAAAPQHAGVLRPAHRAAGACLPLGLQLQYPETWPARRGCRRAAQRPPPARSRPPPHSVKHTPSPLHRSSATSGTPTWSCCKPSTARGARERARVCGEVAAFQRASKQQHTDLSPPLSPHTATPWTPSASPATAAAAC